MLNSKEQPMILCESTPLLVQYIPRIKHTRDLIYYHGKYTKTMLYFLHSTSVPSFYIGLALTLFISNGIILILTWISDHINYKFWEEITYPFQNFKDAAVW